MNTHRKFYLRKSVYSNSFRGISYSERTESSALFPPGLQLSDLYAFYYMNAAVEAWKPLRIKRNL